MTGPGPLVTSQRPTFTWTPSTGADSYDIWIGNQSTGVNPYLTATIATSSYTPTSDIGIGTFNVWVRATNSNGSSAYSPQYNVRVNTAPAPSAVDRWQTTHRPTLTWQTLTGADHYDIWIDDVLGGTSQYIRDTNVSGTSFTPSTDMGIGLYRAWVRGIDAGNDAGDWSSTIEFYVVTSPTVTGGLNPTFDRTPTFAWDASPGAATYEVYVRNRNDGTTAIYQQGIAGTSFTPSTPLADGPYRWWAIAVSSANVRSHWTNPLDIYVGGRTDVLSPTGTTNDTTPTITWRPVDGAQRYELFVDRVGVATGYIQENNLTQTSFTPGTPLPLGDYRAWVRAVSTSNEVAPWSTSLTFTVAALEVEEFMPELLAQQLVSLTDPVQQYEHGQVDMDPQGLPTKPANFDDPSGQTRQPSAETTAFLIDDTNEQDIWGDGPYSVFAALDHIVGEGTRPVEPALPILSNRQAIRSGD